MAWGTRTDIGSVTTLTVTSTSFTVSTNVTAGALIGVMVTTFASTIVGNGTLSDTKNTYILAASSVNPGASVRIEFFFAYNATALTTSDTITYTANGSDVSAFPIMAGFFATGGAGSTPWSSNPQDTSTTKTTSSDTVTFSNIVSNAPSASGDLFVAGVAAPSASTTPTQGSGWAVPPAILNQATINLNTVSGNQINAGSGALTYTPTWSPTVSSWAALVVSFKLPVTAVTPEFTQPPIPPRRPPAMVPLLGFVAPPAAPTAVTATFSQAPWQQLTQAVPVNTSAVLGFAAPPSFVPVVFSQAPWQLRSPVSITAPGFVPPMVAGIPPGWSFSADPWQLLAPTSITTPGFVSVPAAALTPSPLVFSAYPWQLRQAVAITGTSFVFLPPPPTSTPSTLVFSTDPWQLLAPVAITLPGFVFIPPPFVPPPASTLRSAGGGIIRKFTMVGY
jgi:hypothetical protein